MFGFHILQRITIALQKKTVLLKASTGYSSTDRMCAKISRLINGPEIT